MPLSIGIVTPSLNQAAFLEDTIRSILGQDYPNVQYAVVDGGSTDGSVDIIRRHADRLMYWHSRRDRGQSDAINQGLKHLTADVVGYVNSDDTLEPGSLGIVASAFASGERPDVVYGGGRYVDARGRTLQMSPAPDFSLRQLALGNFLSQPAVFVRRSLVDAVGGFREDLSFCMDYDLYLRLAARGARFLPVRMPLATLRQHASSKTVSQQARFQPEVIGVLERFFAEERLPPDVLQVREQALSWAHWLGAMFYADAGKLREAINGVRCCVSWPAFLQDGESQAFALRWATQDMLGARVSLARMQQRLRAVVTVLGPTSLAAAMRSRYSDAFKAEALRCGRIRVFLSALESWAAGRGVVERWAVKDLLKRAWSPATFLRNGATCR